MGLVFMLIVIAAFSGVAFFTKLGIRKSADPLDLNVVLFSAAGLACLALTAFAGGRFPGDGLSGLVKIPVVLWGTASGITGGTAFLLFSYSLKKGHYGLTCTILYSSFLVPVAFSLIFQGEPVSFLLIGGMALVLAALVFAAFSTKRSTGGTDKPSSGSWLILVILVFFLNGFCQITQAVASRSPEHGYFAFMFFFYASSAVLIAFVRLLAVRGKSIGGPAAVYGAAAAACSVAGVFFTLKSLALLPGTLVFPVTLCGPAVAAILLSRLFFREFFSGYSYAAILTGIAGLFLLGIGK